jgi:hypothetical protein
MYERPGASCSKRGNICAQYEGGGAGEDHIEASLKIVSRRRMTVFCTYFRSPSYIL